MSDSTSMNYVVGRGKLYFGQFKPNTRVARGQLYFGNTPELSLSQSEDVLDHYSSDEGVRIKDAVATLQNDATGQFQCDNIALDNLALWFRGTQATEIQTGTATATGSLTIANAVPVDGDKFTVAGHDLSFVAASPTGLEVLIGASITTTAVNLANRINEYTDLLGVTANPSVGVVTLTANEPGTGGNAVTLAKTFTTGANGTVSGATMTGGTDSSETVSDVELGRWYQLGVTADRPQGLQHLGYIEITGVSSDSFVADMAGGRIYLNTDATDITDGDSLTVTYGVEAGTDDIVIAGTEQIEGEMQYIANNAAGENDNYFWPYVKLRPDGDFSLKGDSWLTTTFKFEILKRSTSVERQYITRRRA